MRTERILPWIFFFPIMALYSFLPDLFNDHGYGGQLFIAGIASWVLFMVITFWTGMLGLIRKEYFSDRKGYPELIAGMNLWMLIMCAYQFSEVTVLILPLAGHLFIFALHFFQTSLFTKQNRTL